jgi:hypothetical protein
VAGWLAGSKVIIKLNSAQLELELGLSLAIISKFPKLTFWEYKVLIYNE